MKIHIFLGILLLFIITTCDRQLTAPVQDNPFDSESGLISGNPFILQTQNLSDHILVSWEYTYEKPVIESFLLYRVNGSDLDTLYTGLATTFEDSDVKWDSTYSYYVTGMINEKESSPPDISDIPEVVRRIYVGEDGDYTKIGDALDILNDGDVIHVMNGTYNENIDFKGKKITLYCTGEAGSCILDGGDNSTVITFSGGEDSTTVLDGFSIINGFSNQDGGGMIIDSDPLIKNCIFEGNYTTDYGGAIMIQRAAKPILRNCQFNNNHAHGNGGAIFCDRDSKPIIEYCTFSGNTTDAGDGGAIAVEESTPIILSCLFKNNKANTIRGLGGALSLIDSKNIEIISSEFISNEGKKGGAIYIENGIDIEFSQCIFKSNHAIFGGAFYIIDSGHMIQNSLTNCLLWDNIAYFGGGIYNNNSTTKIDYCTFNNNSANDGNGGAIYFRQNIETLIQNSILWGNIGDITSEIDLNMLYNQSNSLSIMYSNINGGYFGEGNINLNPQFIDSDEGNLQLQDNSPCIGTDNNNTQMGIYGGND